MPIAMEHLSTSTRTGTMTGTTIMIILGCPFQLDTRIVMCTNPFTMRMRTGPTYITATDMIRNSR